MPECPYCRTYAEENDLFCRSCGASLKLPEYDRAFCPHCGARVGASQEFCHECHWSLVKPLDADGFGPASRGKAPAWKRPWVWVAFIAAGVIIASLPWLFTSGPVPPPGPEPRPPKVLEEKPPAVSAPAAPLIKAGEGEAAPPPGTAPAAPVPTKELEDLLNRLREAQLKKDISLYSQAFSPAFPDLAARRQRTLATWQSYTYSGLDFELRDVKLVDAAQATGKVTWRLKFQQQGSPGPKTEAQTYKVWFTKESGEWLISNLERVRRQE